MNRKTSNSCLRAGTHRQAQNNIQFGVAACAISVTPGSEIQLFPAGEFRASDGRPRDVAAWTIDAETASAVIIDFAQRKNRTVIDYEHQTLLTSQNGQPAPASGWFGALEWRESGLYAVDVEWTERATTLIKDGEYKYISPVFTYDKKTGAVKSVLNAALTNNPALDGMDAVAASKFIHLIDQSDKEKLSMEELLNQLRWMLNLPVTATQDDVVGELQKAIDQIKTANAAAVAASDFSIASLVKSQAEQIATLTAAVSNPDPAKYVPVATMKSLQDEVTALRTEKVDREVDDVIGQAIAEGKLLPSMENWARSLGKDNMESLKQYIETAQPIAALRKTQTGGRAPGGNVGGNVDLNDASAIAKAATTWQAEQARAGIVVTTTQAVRHITQQQGA